MNLRLRMAEPPRIVGDGQAACAIPRVLVERRDELALTVALTCHRRLFGYCYFGLQPNYFDRMAVDSGVLVRPIIPTSRVAPSAINPGDIDLLVIPYEGDELVLDRVLAMEVKAIRATYLRQGRSPNDYGFSQAAALSSLGFPYVALAHLIVSDISPRDAWRETSAATVLDVEGRLSEFFTTHIDMMPADLIRRAYGRLERNCVHPNLGLVAAYVENHSFEAGARSQTLWNPWTRPAAQNPKRDDELLMAVGALYQTAPQSFMAIPRYAPQRRRSRKAPVPRRY